MIRIVGLAILFLLSACGGSSTGRSSDEGADREGVDGETGATRDVTDLRDALQGNWGRGCARSNADLIAQSYSGGGPFITTSLQVENNSLLFIFQGFSDDSCETPIGPGTRVITTFIATFSETDHIPLSDGTYASEIELQIDIFDRRETIMSVIGDTLYLESANDDRVLSYEDPLYRR